MASQNIASNSSMDRVEENLDEFIKLVPEKYASAVEYDRRIGKVERDAAETVTSNRMDKWEYAWLLWHAQSQLYQWYTSKRKSPRYWDLGYKFTCILSWIFRKRGSIWLLHRTFMLNNCLTN